MRRSKEIYVCDTSDIWNWGVRLLDIENDHAHSVWAVVDRAVLGAKRRHLSRDLLLAVLCAKQWRRLEESAL